MKEMLSVEEIDAFEKNSVSSSMNLSVYHRLCAQARQAVALREALVRAGKVSACLAGMHYENGDPMSPAAQLSVASALNQEILAALSAKANAGEGE